MASKKKKITTFEIRYRETSVCECTVNATDADAARKKFDAGDFNFGDTRVIETVDVEVTGVKERT